MRRLIYELGQHVARKNGLIAEYIKSTGQVISRYEVYRHNCSVMLDVYYKAQFENLLVALQGWQAQSKEIDNLRLF